jgi:hypothetical protein
MKPKQEEALRDYLRESIVPLIEDVLTKKLGQAITFAKEELAAPVQEPVATVQCVNGITIGYLEVMQAVGTKLYTTPPAAHAQEFVCSTGLCHYKPAAQPAPVQPVQNIDHCIWARNGNTPCPHTTPPSQRTEPPAWFHAVENILNEYGLQAIDFVADFKAAMKDAERSQRAWVGSGDLEDSNAYQTPPAVQPAPVPMAHIVGEIDHCGKVWKPAQPATVPEHDWKAEYLKSVESGCITLDELREALAELNATNRQVEILSDALAESRRQRPWVDLTDVNAVELWQLARHDIVEFARAIEAKLKEKNT